VAEGWERRRGMARHVLRSAVAVRRSRCVGAAALMGKGQIGQPLESVPFSCVFENDVDARWAPIIRSGRGAQVRKSLRPAGSFLQGANRVNSLAGQAQDRPRAQAGSGHKPPIRTNYDVVANRAAHHERWLQLRTITTTAPQRHLPARVAPTEIWLKSPTQVVPLSMMAPVC